MNQLTAIPPADETEAVIDEALHHVANQWVLRQMLSGEAWARAFGIGGRYSQFDWSGDAKGISLRHGENTTLIKPARILERVKQYAGSGQLSLSLTSTLKR